MRAVRIESSASGPDGLVSRSSSKTHPSANAHPLGPFDHQINEQLTTVKRDLERRGVEACDLHRDWSVRGP